MKAYFLFFSIYLLISTVLWHITPSAGHYDIDSYGYDSIAIYFAKTGDMTDPYQLNSAPIQPVGYPFVVGLLYRLFGHDVRPILFVQILLMCLALGLLMLIAQRFAGAAVARLTGLFFLLSPGFYIYPQLLLAEVIMIVVLLFLLERYSLFLQTGRVWALITAGFCAGISMLIKPVVMLFVIVLAMLTWYSMLLHKKSSKQAFVFVILLITSFAAPVMLYTMRNYVRYGYASFAPMMPLNIYQVFLAKVMSQRAGKDPQEIIENELRFKGVHSFDAAGWNQARNLFKQHICCYPQVCAKVWAENVCKTWCGLYVTQLKKMLEPDGSLIGHSFFMQSGTMYERVYAYIAGGTSFFWIVLLGWYECIWSVLRLLFAGIGLYVIFKKNRLLAWLLFGFCVSLSLPTGIDGCCRYRIVFEAILILLSAIGFLGINVHCFYTKEGARGWIFQVKKWLPAAWQ